MVSAPLLLVLAVALAVTGRRAVSDCAPGLYVDALSAVLVLVISVVAAVADPLLARLHAP